MEKKLQDTYVDCLDPELVCVQVILLSKHFCTGILMQRVDVILERIFFTT